MSNGSTIIGGDPISQGPSVQVGASDDPYLIEVVAPIESETKDATLAEIRGDAPADRSTLGDISNALDAQDADFRRYARRRALIAAIAFR